MRAIHPRARTVSKNELGLTGGNMKVGSRHWILGALGATVASLLSIAPASGQTQPQRIAEATPEEKPLMAEQVFKNVQLLKGISVKEFMETMGFFAASTNKTCTTRHGDGSGGSRGR